LRTFSDITDIQRWISNHIKYTLNRTRDTIDPFGMYQATAYSVRNRLTERWNATNKFFTETGAKQVCYLSLEWLMGRALQNALLNIHLSDQYGEALHEFGYQMENLYDHVCAPFSTRLCRESDGTTVAHEANHLSCIPSRRCRLLSFTEPWEARAPLSEDTEDSAQWWLRGEIKNTRRDHTSRTTIHSVGTNDKRLLFLHVTAATRALLSSFVSSSPLHLPLLPPHPRNATLPWATAAWAASPPASSTAWPP